jgi:hypothetical protein
VALQEWEQILDYDMDRIAALLSERSERASRLRQSSPFTGILTESERMAVYESYATRTCHSRGKRDLG